MFMPTFVLSVGVAKLTWANFRMHHMHCSIAQMRPIVTYVACSVVCLCMCLSVCVLGTWVDCAKWLIDREPVWGKFMC